ncbi:MAG: N-acetylmuramoyl-L-alanine amidase [Pseudomonadota bacterium]
MQVLDRPSPNFDARKRVIDMIVLHYTGMKSGVEALHRLCDSDAKVSAHYLVEEDGRLFRLVQEEDRAWHAGRGSWRGDDQINGRSIGVEIVNPGHEWGYRPFPEEQINAVLELVLDIAKRHSIAPSLVLGHSDVAPRRKEDPGELFPWDRLAAAGLALGTYQGEGDPSVFYEAALNALSEIGYDAPSGDHAAGLLAFQRRFVPASLGKGFDALTKAALIDVAKKVRAHTR